ncbi:MAG TPA: hypothetical protein PKH77_19265 [Anaerolineae bacterium]|nr:hypothetical protein [Anaerolineae bacterium]
MMTKFNGQDTRLTVAARAGWVCLRLRIRTRWLLALLAALAAATSSPALLAFLERVGH